MKGLKILFHLNCWFYLSPVRYNLFNTLVNEGMVCDFAYKKVVKLSKKQCKEYLDQLKNKAYRQGYSDGDYFNYSQNPYDFKINPVSFWDYEKGFKACKADKLKLWKSTTTE